MALRGSFRTPRHPTFSVLDELHLGTWQIILGSIKCLSGRFVIEARGLVQVQMMEVLGPTRGQI
jgi:hypothetical protein